MSPESNRFAQYLRARRAQVKPEDVGFPQDAVRRVAGLKREEVAELAGISLEYYTRLEQGQPYQLSEQVLSGLSRALRLDADAARYFYRLALPEPPTRSTGTPSLSEHVIHLVDGWSDVPVFVEDSNLDIVVANDLSRAIFPFLAPGSNAALSMFSVPDKVRALDGWLPLARACVAGLRFQADPNDPRLQEIVGELSVRDPLFRELWADHHAEPFTSGEIDVFVDGFGLVRFDWQMLNVPGGLQMVVWAPASGSLAADAIDHVRAKLRTEAA